MPLPAGARLHWSNRLSAMTTVIAFSKALRVMDIAWLHPSFSIIQGPPRPHDDNPPFFLSKSPPAPSCSAGSCRALRWHSHVLSSVHSTTRPRPRMAHLRFDKFRIAHFAFGMFCQPLRKTETTSTLALLENNPEGSCRRTRKRRDIQRALP